MKKAQIKAEEEISDAEKLRRIQEKKTYEQVDEMTVNEIWRALILEGKERPPVSYFEIMQFKEYLKRTCPSSIFTIFLIGRLVQEGIDHIEKQEKEVYKRARIRLL
jgi:hypothetical protein